MKGWPLSDAFVATRPAWKHAGFTLIELVVVMIIIGIITAIALPNYTQYVQRSNRSDARTQLLMAAQWMERFRNENSTYVGAALPLSLRCSPSNATGVGCRNYAIALSAAPAVTAATYTLEATPVAGGPMMGDVCGVIAVTATGIRTPATDLCWGR